MRYTSLCLMAALLLSTAASAKTPFSITGTIYNDTSHDVYITGIKVVAWGAGRPCTAPQERGDKSIAQCLNYININSQPELKLRTKIPAGGEYKINISEKSDHIGACSFFSPQGSHLCYVAIRPTYYFRSNGKYCETDYTDGVAYGPIIGAYINQQMITSAKISATPASGGICFDSKPKDWPSDL